MHKSFILVAIITSSGFSAANTCQSSPVECNADSCRPCFCLGPAQVQANAPVNPRTCDGDVVITVAALYWQANEDGLEYALGNNVRIAAIHTLIDADYKTPHFDRDFGNRLGLAYHSPCDGWDIGILWTNFRGTASSIDYGWDFDGVQQVSGLEAIQLLPLWSAFNGVSPGVSEQVTYANTIKTDWRCDINLVDISLGREYWVSKYLSFKPVLGVRISKIGQKFNLVHEGGVWLPISSDQPVYCDEVRLENDFEGVGVLAGLDLSWHVGCGWSIYSQLTTSIGYGRFDVKHRENVREVQSPFAKTQVLSTESLFRASRGMLDLGLGVEYSTLFCDCKYGFIAQLGWEQHLFFHQNQMWRVNRIEFDASVAPFPNNNGENIQHQRRGTLSTQGLTLSFQFAF